MIRLPATLLLVGLILGGCASADPYARDYRARPLHDRSPRGAEPVGFVDIPYATWTDAEPEYRLYPGDQLDVTVLSAPELNRSVVVQPDGRITMPLVPPMMVADRSPAQVEAMLSQAYASQLIRPDVSVALKQATTLKVFVGGEVDKPGVYDMPGDIDALQAVIMAGGFRNTAKAHEVVILRRGPGGVAMMRTADLTRAARHAGADAVPLRRFDIVYVPKTGLAEVAAFFAQIRDALPFQFSYVINGQYVSSR
jgi:polysaccharide export outer membrane protein